MTTRSFRIQARNLVSYNPDVRSNPTQALQTSREMRFMNTIALAACIAVIGVVPCIITNSVRKEKGMDGGSDIEILFCFSLALLNLYCCHKSSELCFLRLSNYRKTFLVLYWRHMDLIDIRGTMQEEMKMLPVAKDHTAVKFNKSFLQSFI